MLKRFVLVLAMLVAVVGAPLPALARSGSNSGSLSDTYSADELVNTGSAFFGSVAQGLASVVEKAVSQFGLPNGYILGDEGSGAVILGARYGQGTMYTRNAGDLTVYWQGPSVGWDFGGNASKMFVLVYNLREPDRIFQKFPGVDGSFYLVAGLGVNYMRANGITLAPMRSGVGLRAGVSAGYVTFTRQQTYNPF